MAGRVVGGRYELESVIGSGGMGSVWRAHDTVLDRTVAVKELHLSAHLTDAQLAETTRLAMTEAKNAARLSHPAIVTVFDVVVEDARPWIVMQLIEGRSLEQAVTADGPWSVADTGAAGIVLLDALAAAHAAGIVHRDVKPSNVLVGTDGKVYLTDFSIARAVGAGTTTSTGFMMGSPGYTAPERFVHGGLTPASDLFGLGATLYFAVEGHGPFDKDDAMASAFAAATLPHPPAGNAEALAAVLDGLLIKDPQQRLGAAEARRRIEEAVGSGSGATTAGASADHGSASTAAAGAVTEGAEPDEDSASSVIAAGAMPSVADEADGASGGQAPKTPGSGAVPGLAAAGSPSGSSGTLELAMPPPNADPDLETTVLGRGAPSHPPASGGPDPAGPGRRRRRRHVTLTTAAVIAVAVLTVSSVALTMNGGSTSSPASQSRAGKSGSNDSVSVTGSTTTTATVGTSGSSTTADTTAGTTSTPTTDPSTGSATGGSAGTTAGTSAGTTAGSAGTTAGTSAGASGGTSGTTAGGGTTVGTTGGSVTPTLTLSPTLSVSPGSGTAPLAVHADAGGSTAGGQTIISYAFDFGDGTTVGSSGSAGASHTYQNPGTYTVTVTVSTDHQKSGSASQQVAVSAPPPMDRPGVAFDGHDVFVLAATRDGKLYCDHATFGKSFEGWKLLAGDTALPGTAPTAVIVGGWAYLAVTSPSGTVDWSASPSTACSFGSWVTVGGLSSQYGPALFTTSGGTLNLLATGTDGQCYGHVGLHAGTWTSVGGTLTSAPAAVADPANDYLFAVGRGLNHQVWIQQGYLAKNSFVGWGLSPGSDALASPTIAGDGDNFATYRVGPDHHIYVSSWKLGGGATGWQEINGGGNSQGDLSAAASTGYVFLACTGNDGNLWLNQGAMSGFLGQWFPLGHPSG